jgi:hypothetical protein
MRAGILCINSATLNANIALAYLAQKIPQAKELERAFRLQNSGRQPACHTFDWDLALLRCFTIVTCSGGSS